MNKPEQQASNTKHRWLLLTYKSDVFDLVSLDPLCDDDPILGSFWPLGKHRRLLLTYRVMSDSSQPIE